MACPRHRRTLWQLIVTRLPPDWFKDEHLAQLRAFCQHVWLAEMLAPQLEEFDPATLVTEAGRLHFEQLARMLDKEHRAMLGLARALRLTVSSSVTTLPQRRGSRSLARIRSSAGRRWL